jgi:hypothetical protein
MNKGHANYQSGKVDETEGKTQRPGPVRRFVTNYAARHRHPGNIAFHAAGLPITFILPWFAGPLWGWAWAAGAFVVGYGLQFAGHAIEGNDAGEIVLLKKWLGLPYREFGPEQNCKSGSA